jgi:hypothetical protein
MRSIGFIKIIRRVTDRIRSDYEIEHRQENVCITTRTHKHTDNDTRTRTHTHKTTTAHTHLDQDLHASFHHLMLYGVKMVSEWCWHGVKMVLARCQNGVSKQGVRMVAAWSQYCVCVASERC